MKRCQHQQERLERPHIVIGPRGTELPIHHWDKNESPCCGFGGLYFLHVIGFTPTPSFIYNGERSEPASEMLKPATQRDNLHVLTNAHVTRVRKNPFQYSTTGIRQGQNCTECQCQDGKMLWSSQKKHSEFRLQKQNWFFFVPQKFSLFSISAYCVESARLSSRVNEQLELNMWRMVDSRLCQPRRKSSCQLVLLVLLISSCCLALATRNTSKSLEWAFLKFLHTQKEIFFFQVLFN